MPEYQHDTKSALKRALPVTVITFVNTRYLSDDSKREKTIRAIQTRLNDFLGETELEHISVTDETDLQKLKTESSQGAALFVPMSGSVQSWIEHAAQRFDVIGIFPAYDSLLMPQHVADTLLALNAAPATLEMYAVLKNRHFITLFVTEPDDLKAAWRAAQAVFRLQQTRLLLVGDTEPWVLSSERDLQIIKKRTGIDIEHIALDELYTLFERIPERESAELASRYIKQADEMIEPSKEDMVKSARLILAFERLLQIHKADGASIACFKLLADLGTTSCMALSYLNAHPAYIGGCEGDVDSAITLALLKALSEKPGWMGNPIVGKDMKLELVHCTAPLCFRRDNQPFRLRNHHESGIGVSPEVNVPLNDTITLCRLSVNQGKLSAYVGKTRAMPSKPTCRTQIQIELKNISQFMKHLLGLHQSLVYGNYVRELEIFAEIMDLEFMGKGGENEKSNR